MKNIWVVMMTIVYSKNGDAQETAPQKAFYDHHLAYDYASKMNEKHKAAHYYVEGITVE